METTQTTAEQIADLFDGDGSRFETEDGREISDVCDERGADWTRIGSARRARFSDGSVLIIDGAGWDLALDPTDDECHCWQGLGQHSPTCHQTAG